MPKPVDMVRPNKTQDACNLGAVLAAKFSKILAPFSVKIAFTFSRLKNPIKTREINPIPINIAANLIAEEYHVLLFRKGASGIWLKFSRTR